MNQRDRNSIKEIRLMLRSWDKQIDSIWSKWKNGEISVEEAKQRAAIYKAKISGAQFACKVIGRPEDEE